jgi:RNA polymerase sigma-70 factor (ECF subfamily)
LTVVTRNAALAMARAAQRRAAREATVERQDHADSTEDVVSRLERGVEAQRLRRAVMELSPEQRDVISQAYFGRRTLAEIAQRTGTPLGTVKRRAQLALAKLAKALESVS